MGLPGTETIWNCPADNFDGVCSSSYPYPGVPPLSQLLSQRSYFYDNNTSYAAMPTQGVLSWKRTLMRYAGANYSDPRYPDEEFTYDDWGNLTTVTSYNSVGTSASRGTGSPQTATTIYDPTYHAFAITTTNALSQSTSYTYDYDVGLPTSLTGPNGEVTTVTVEYDDFGRLLKVVRPWDDLNNPTMQFSYNDYAYPFRIELRQRSEGSQYAVFERYYNGLGQLIQTQTEDAVLDVGTKDIVADTWYDEYGRVERQSVPYAVPQQSGYSQPDTDQSATQTSYDVLGRTLTVTAPNTVDTHYFYRDLETRVMNGRDNTTRYLNDIWGRTIQVIPLNGDNDGSPINPSVSYSFDALDRLVGVNRGGATTSLTYDYAGRKLSMNDPDMGAWLYSYNPVGTLSYQKDARNQYICLYYDQINRVQGKHYRQDASCPSEPNPYNVRYLYDDSNPQNGQYGIGLRTGMQDATGSASWSFDARGRTWKESRSINSIGTFVTQWSYNQADLLVSMVYPGGDNGSLGEQINYTYHPQLTINTISGLPQYLHHDILQSTTYDAANRTVQRVLGENTLRTSFAYHPWNTTDYGGLLQQILTQTTGGTPTTYQDLRYTQYDRSGNIRTIQDYVTGAPQIQSFEYDNLDRLISGGASGGGQGNFSPESYNYDSTTGNLSSKAGVSYTYGDQNHKHAVTALSNGNTYSNDANGNMTYRHVYEGGNWKNYTLSYDGENRLATVTGPVTANFKYDGDSKRVRATINGGLDTVFIGNYFEWNVTAGTKRTYYYAGATRIAMRENGSDPQWILGDHLGSTSKMVSYAGADTGGQWYKAWGETRLQTGTIPTKNQYTGQYNQVIIGLYYYGARWYDTALSRWTQPDSIVPSVSKENNVSSIGYGAETNYSALVVDYHETRFLGQLNQENRARLEDPQAGLPSVPTNLLALDRYSYSFNNPLVYTDPDGHFVFLVPLLAGAIIGAAISTGVYLAASYASGQDPTLVGALGVAAGGAVAGVVSVFAAPLAGTLLGVAGIATSNTALAVGTVAVNAAGGAASYLVGGATQNVVNTAMGNSPTFQPNVGEALFSAAIGGAVSFSVGNAFPVSTNTMRTLSQARYFMPGRTIGTLIATKNAQNLYTQAVTSVGIGTFLYEIFAE